MLGLRGLLSRVQAEPAALERNRELIRLMFATSDSADGDGGDCSARAPLSPASPSAMTAAFLGHQRSVHAELMRMSEQYTRGDARTVRIDVSRLDELQPDLADAACASFLFNLRPAAAMPTEQAEAVQSSTEGLPEAEQRQQQEGHLGRDEAAAQPAISAPRRLLLRAVAQAATEAELRLLHALLPERLRLRWTSCAEQSET